MNLNSMLNNERAKIFLERQIISIHFASSSRKSRDISKTLTGIKIR